MRVMSAGSGYKYLLKSVAGGDGDRSLSMPLTRYYAEKGSPPGRWLGSAVRDLGSGAISPGDVVTEDQLRLLLGEGRDPMTGSRLGRAYPDYQEETPGAGSDTGRGIGSYCGVQRGRRRAVAGYDFTFSVPKSVSVLWALGDSRVQSQIVEAHHAAVGEVVDLMEREVVATRAGFATAKGAVAQVAVTGLIATAYDHYDSRTGDPQLHTHVVVSNKVRTVYDGKWRSIDGRPMHAATVALSEHYNGVLADQLTRRLGFGWARRDRGRDRNPSWEIGGVSDRLIEAFSSRSRAIEVATRQLVAHYESEHGRTPTATTIIRLRAQATLSTRPFKTPRSLMELTAEWRGRAAGLLGADPTDWVRSVLQRDQDVRVMSAENVDNRLIGELADQVVAAVEERRSTWRRWNLHAEASRQIMGWRFASVSDREAVLGMVVDASEAKSLRLTPPELAMSPAVFRRPAATSVFRPANSTVFTSNELLAAENRLLDLSRTTTGPRAPSGPQLVTVGRERTLTADQVAAVRKVAGSGRVVDLLVGAAGTGKTTTTRALRTAWELQHGPGSVVGLAPSAAAAQVLGEDLGVVTENTAKWLHDHQRGAVALKPGQLVVLDEASLAGTLTVDRVAKHAAEIGAKVLLVGDLAQLTAVDAGGVFGMLVRDRDDVAELTELHRFHHAWERAASLGLRAGDATVIDTYQTHDRLREGGGETMLDHAYQGWSADTVSGKSSILVAESADTTTMLNTRARLDRIVAGHVRSDSPVRLHDGTEASYGDVVLTRRNNRKLRSGRTWVKNGDRWIVTAVNPDGSIRIRPAGMTHGSLVTLPAEYVADHVDLAYAITAYRAQGVTVDTAHTVVQPSMTREGFYVAMTRGRHANTAYVVTDQPEDEHHQHDIEASGRAVLTGVIRHVGAELSAHEVLAAGHEQWAGIDQLAAEYETIAASATRDRWVSLLGSCGLTAAQAESAIDSDAFGPLASALRRAEAYHLNPEHLLAHVVSNRSLDGADDIASVLHYRVNQAISKQLGRTRHRPQLIVGLIPRVEGILDDDTRQALQERHDLIERRAAALAETALAGSAPWTRLLNPPGDVGAYQLWIRQVVTVAAYRDRYHITSDDPLGPWADSVVQQTDRAMAKRALAVADRLQNEDHQDSVGSPSEERSAPGIVF